MVEASRDNEHAVEAARTSRHAMGRVGNGVDATRGSATTIKGMGTCGIQDGSRRGNCENRKVEENLMALIGVLRNGFSMRQPLKLG